jgi:hypothetical protein
MKRYRYELVPYAGRKSRGTCPRCGQLRCYSRYMDTRTGDMLPEHYGRCNHEASCAYFVSPKDIEADGTSYAQRIRQEQKLSTLRAPRPSFPRRVPPAPTKVVCIPQAVYQQSMRKYEQNAFAKLLRHYFGCDMERELLRKFHVGTSKYWPDACVFWLIDERGRIRNGQVVQFDESGRTVKIPERRTRWMHTAMTRSLQSNGMALPDWLNEHNSTKGSCSYLYGLFQLATAPASYPIAVVESPKTAVIASVYFPQFIWMATLGLGNLNSERLEPLRGRRIVLWPDVGGYNHWQTKAAALSKSGFTIQVSDLLEKKAVDEQGLDLADILLREWSGYPPSWDEKEL